MKGRPLRVGLVGAVVAAALSGTPASAQISSGGGPISYSADNLEYVDARRQLVLTGNVDIMQDDARLRADKLVLYFSASSQGGGDNSGGLGSGDIERVVADGKVYYVRPDQTAVGNYAVYDMASDTVTFTGDVVVSTPENVIRGERLVLEISGGRTTLAPGGGKRVQGVFRPRQSKPSAEAPAPAPAPQQQ
jgi:lipopolysaccharide export system protein LptA